MNINEAADIMYGEERKMEIADVKAATRDEKIGQLTKEYFEDVGTFFEWIQLIEIDEKDYYSPIHKCMTGKFMYDVGSKLTNEFCKFCEGKAIEEIDNE